MSLFLGKIHYWLFNKIIWFEALEEEIINLAKEEGIDVDSLSIEVNNKYGEKLPNAPLEDLIDTSNIHGWLQARIHSAEYRFATWTLKVLEKEDGKEKLEKVFINQGIKAANEVIDSGITLNNAIEIYNEINNYILDGMPCDRVNEFIEQEENKVVWKRRVCVHKEIWNTVGVDVNIFYNLRDLWIKAFINKINNEYNYCFLGNDEYSIERI